MRSDLQAKELQLPVSIAKKANLEQTSLEDDEVIGQRVIVEEIGHVSHAESSGNETTNKTTGLSFTTLSLVDTIEYNFLKREHSGIFSDKGKEAEDMGSSVSVKKATEPQVELVQTPELDSSTEDERRSSLVEVCMDPGLEEAEGIAHAQLVTKINSTFDNGFTAKTPDSASESMGFANILDEYKANNNKSPRGKIQKSPGKSGKQETNQAAMLNLTLTGLKAKQIDRFSVSSTSPRGLTRDKTTQRTRNPNVMKSLEDRLFSSQKNMKKRPDWNQNPKVEKSSPAKSGKVRKFTRKVNLLAAIKPSNLDQQKEKFFASNFTINPQFEYRYPANETVLARYNTASSMYLEEAIAILQRVLRRYGNYEKFEAATGGRLLSKTEIWNTVKRYLEREGFFGDIVVDISNDLLSRAAMTIIGGRPTLSIRESSAREYWVEGLLRHEVGTHHLRFHNNRQQIWHNANVRRQMEMQPANPTEEGLASLHSVLMRKDPSLWRAAMLYYAVHKASTCSFVELFADLGRFLDSPEVRWDYCLRTKRGQTDTSKPGCFCKDQVYLNGILALLQRRKTLDFHMLCVLGKVSYDDVERLSEKCNKEGTKIPTFMRDIDEYRRRLDYIVHMNGLERFLEGRKDDRKAP